MRSVYVTLSLLVAVVGYALASPDAQASRVAGCSGYGCSAAEGCAGAGSCAGEYTFVCRGEGGFFVRLFGFERRHARREARHERWASHGGCGGESASCGGESYGCDAGGYGYPAPPPAVSGEATCPYCGKAQSCTHSPDCTCPECAKAKAVAPGAPGECPIDPATGQRVCPKPATN